MGVNVHSYQRIYTDGFCYSDLINMFTRDHEMSTHTGTQSTRFDLFYKFVFIV